jgi:RNA polymerase sigma-70 factor (ECF subfamily)
MRERKGAGGVAIRQDETDPTDEQWIRALQRRDAWAWDLLHQRTLERVFAYVHRHCRRREDAEDLTAEVYAAAVASIDRFRGDASVITWLIGIARRKLIDAARRRGRHPELLEADLPVTAADMAPVAGLQERAAAEDPELALEQKETAAHVRRLILQLPEAQQEALLLRCVDELSLAEIARTLSRSENAVKGLLHRAKAALHEQLAAEAGEEPTDSGPGATRTTLFTIGARR